MKQQKKKGTTLYRQMWGFIIFIEIMFLFVMGRVIANVWPTLGSKDNFVDVNDASFYGDTMNPRDFQD